MNLLKNYNKVTRLSYGSVRVFSAQNKFSNPSFNSQSNYSATQRSENQGQDNTFNASGFGSSNVRNPSGSDFVNTATSVAQNVVNTAADLAGSTIRNAANTAQGMVNVAASVGSNVMQGNQNQNRQDDSYHSDPRREQYYRRDSHPEQFTSTDTRYNMFNEQNQASSYQRSNESFTSTVAREVASGITGTIMKGIADTASSIASNVLPGGQRSQNPSYREEGNYPNRNDNIITSTVRGVSDVAQGIANVATSVVSSFIPGSQSSNRDPTYDNRSRYDQKSENQRNDFMYTGSEVQDLKFNQVEKTQESRSAQLANTTKEYVNTAGAMAQDLVGMTASGIRDFTSKTSDVASSAANNFLNNVGSATLSAVSSAARSFNEAASSTDRATNSEQNFVYSGTQVREDLGFVPTEDQGLHTDARHKIPLYDIVISGGGVAGGALACAVAHFRYFSKEDKKIILLDPSEPPSLDRFHDKKTIPDQRVVSLSLASVDFLKELGVWSLLNRDRIGVINQMQVWEIGGNSFIKFNDNPANEIGYVLELSHLQAALFERMRSLENVKIETNKITDLRNEPGSFATVTLNDEEKISARLVVGSDGINSIVKKKSKISSTGWSCLQQGIVCTVKTPYRNTTAWQRFLSTGPLAVLPLWDEFSSIVWSCGHTLFNSLMQCSDEEFLKELNYQLTRKPYYDTPNLVLGANSGFDLPPVITEICNKRRSFPLSMAQANQFVAPRVALIGDAAHNIHPLAGQGLNLGLTDAAYLSNVIVKNLITGNDIGNQDLLKEYEVSSMNLNSAMMYSLEYIKRMYESNDNGPAVFLRNIATGAINNLTPMKSLFVDAANGKYSQPIDYEWKKV